MDQSQPREPMPTRCKVMAVLGFLTIPLAIALLPFLYFGFMYSHYLAYEAKLLSSKLQSEGILISAGPVDTSDGAADMAQAEVDIEYDDIDVPSQRIYLYPPELADKYKKNADPFIDISSTHWMVGEELLQTDEVLNRLISESKKPNATGIPHVIFTCFNHNAIKLVQGDVVIEESSASLEEKLISESEDVSLDSTEDFLDEEDDMNRLINPKVYERLQSTNPVMPDPSDKDYAACHAMVQKIESLKAGE